MQEALFDHGREQHLLLLEHPHVFTYGPRADLGSQRALSTRPPSAPTSSPCDRGGDVTYHGPGQLVGYPILSVAEHSSVRPSTCATSSSSSSTRSATSACRRRPPRRVPGRVGRRRRARPAQDLRHRRAPEARAARCTASPSTSPPTCATCASTSSPCGIADRPVTSLAEEGVDVPDARRRRRRRPPRRRAVGRAGAPSARTSRGGTVPTTCRRSPAAPGPAGWWPTAGWLATGAVAQPVRLRSRLDAPGSPAGSTSGRASRSGCAPRCATARGAGAQAHGARPRPGDGVRGGRLPEPVGVLGRRHGDVHGARRALHAGVRLLPRRHPQAGRAGTPTSRRASPRPSSRWASTTPCSRWWPATTSPTAGWPTSRRASRRSAPRRPATRVETLISDAKGDAASLDALFAVRPDVLNHNVETVARLQRAVRPSAGYARSLSRAGPGQGGRADDEVRADRRPGRDRRRGRRRCSADLAAIGVDIVTIGQYLRPTSHHLPVDRWVEPASSGAGRRVGERLGIGHVEASPLTRSSYHAKSAADARHPGRRPALMSTAESCVGAIRAPRIGVHSVAHWRPRRPRRLPRPHRPGPRGDGRPGHRRAAGVGRPRPAVPHRLRGDAARAADDARRATRRRRHAGRARGSRRRGSSSSPACSRCCPWGETETRSPLVAKLAAGGVDGGRRRPDVGPLPRRAAAAAARHRVPPRRRRRSARCGCVKDAAEIDALRAAGAAADRVAAAAAGRRDPARRAHRGRRCRPTSRPASSPRATTRSTSPSSPPARTPPARTTTPADRVIERRRDRAVRLRRHDGRLLQRHHPLRVHRRRRRPRSPRPTPCCTRPRPPAVAAAVGRHAVRGRRPRRPRGSSPPPATATTSSTAPATASAWRSTRTPTSSRATARPLVAGHAFSVEPGHLRARPLGDAPRGHRRRHRRRSRPAQPRRPRPGVGRRLSVVRRSADRPPR